MSASSAPSPATNATGDSVSMCSTPMSSSKPPPSGCRPAKLLNLPPGYHFVPTDYELVVHYLRPRLAGNHRLPLPIFIHERILDYHPDILIEKYRNYGEGRWFFFTARERKHVGGNRPNRTTPDNGHWNATGSIRPIRSARGLLVGCRRTLVFYETSRSRKKSQAGLPAAEEEQDGDGGQAAAKAKDGVKTEWTMNEYQSLASEAEFEAIRKGNAIANKMDELVLCTIQKKKHSHESGETKKSTKRKTKEEGLELETVPDAAAAAAGDVEQGSRAGTTEGQDAAGDVEQGSRAGTTEGVQDEDHVQRALMEAAAKPQAELAYHAPAAGADNFNIDPDQNMAYYYLTNSLSPEPTPPQETLMVPASGDNNIAMHQQNYYFINQSMNMKNSQSFHAQATPPQEFLPYLDTQMAASRGGGNTMDDMLQNRFGNMTPSQPGTGRYISPRCSKSDVWQRSAELLRDKPNRQSLHFQAKLSGRELNNPYVSVTNSSSFVPTPHQETTVMALATRVQETLPQEEFLPYSNTKMAASLGAGSIVDHHMLQNRITNVMSAEEAHTFTGFFASLTNSNYGYIRMDRPGPSSVSFPSHQSHGVGSRTGMQGPLLNNQVNLNHQNSAAASMLGYDQRNGVRYDQRNGVGFSTQDRIR